MSTLIKALLGAVVGLSSVAAAHAGEGYAWRHHAAPFDFLFDNHFDTHQQTKRARDGSLSGFLYIRYTGVITKDRYRVASHADCNDADCSVGWQLDGQPTSGVLLHHAMHDHPLFQVRRADIPQPGSYSHFHWLGGMPPHMGAVDGYLLQLKATSSFCFIHHGWEGATGAATCRENGGIEVDPGIDTATHLNIVASPAHGM